MLILFHRCFLSCFGTFGQAASEKIFKNRLIRKNNCLWWPCFLTDREEMCNPYRGPSIATSYNVLVHLAKRFQKRIFFKISCGSHICYQIGTIWAIFIEDFSQMVLPSFGLFGHAVSEENNFFRLTNQKQELSVAAMFVYGSGRNVHSL